MSRAVSPEPAMPALGDLPDDLPGENDLVRAVFHRCERDALEVLVEDTIIYLVPWCARRGGIAGFEQDIETFEVRPVEFTGNEVRRLLERHVPREVPLTATPAWLLTPADDGPPVSWHARVRWAERIQPMADPGPAIRDAWENGLQVGVPQGYGRYYPPENAVICYFGSTYDDPLVVTTVLAVDDVAVDEEIGADHLAECDICGALWDTTVSQACRRCQWHPRPRPNRRLPAVSDGT